MSKIDKDMTYSTDKNNSKLNNNNGLFKSNIFQQIA
jgi:hypothetical protein